MSFSAMPSVLSAHAAVSMLRRRGGGSSPAPEEEEYFSYPEALAWAWYLSCAVGTFGAYFNPIIGGAMALVLFIILAGVICADWSIQ